MRVMSLINTFDNNQNIQHITIPCRKIRASGLTSTSWFNFIEKAIIKLTMLGLDDPLDIANRLMLDPQLVLFEWALLRERGMLKNSMASETAINLLDKYEEQAVSFEVLQEEITGNVLPICFSKIESTAIYNENGYYSVGETGRDLNFNFLWQVNASKLPIARQLVERDFKKAIDNTNRLRNKWQNTGRVSALLEAGTVNNLDINGGFNESVELHCVCYLDSDNEMVKVSFFDSPDNFSAELTNALYSLDDYDFVKYHLLLNSHQYVDKTTRQQLAKPQQQARASQSAASAASATTAVATAATAPTAAAPNATSNQSAQSGSSTGNKGNKGNKAAANQQVDPVQKMPVDPTLDLQTQHRALQNSIFQVNYNFDQLKKNDSNFERGKGEQDYLAHFQKCVFNLYSSMEQLLWLLVKDENLSFENYNPALFASLQRTFNIKLLPDVPVVIALMPSMRINFSDIDALSQLSYADLVEAFKVYCFRNDLPLIGLGADQPAENGTKAPDGFAEGHQMTLGAFGAEHGQRALLKTTRYTSPRLKALVQSNGAELNSLLAGLYALVQNYSEIMHKVSLNQLQKGFDTGSDIRALVMLNLLLCLQQQTNQAISGEQQAKSKQQPAHQANAFTTKRQALARVVRDCPYFVGNLLAIKPLRDAFSHGSGQSNLLSLAALESEKGMLLSLVKQISNNLAKVLLSDPNDKAKLYQDVKSELNAKLTLMHYFNHRFFKFIGMYTSYELFCAEKWLQSDQVKSAMELNRPAYLDLVIRNNNDDDSFGGNGGSGSGSGQKQASGAGAGVSDTSVSNTGVLNTQNTGGNAAGSATASGLGAAWVDELIQGKQAYPVENGDQDISSQSLVKLAGVCQMLFEHQISLTHFDRDMGNDLMKTNISSFVASVAVKISQAGFILKNHQLPIELTSTRHYFVKGALRGGSSTLGGVLLAYFKVSQDETLKRLAQAWPTMIVDLSELIVLRRHGDNLIKLGQAFNIKTRIYRGLASAYTSMLS